MLSPFYNCKLVSHWSSRFVLMGTLRSQHGGYTIKENFFDFCCFFYTGLWGAPTQNPAPEIFFIFKNNKFLGAGFFITCL